MIALLLAAIAGVLHSRTLFSPPVLDDKMQLTVEQIFTDYATLFGALPRWLSYGTFAWTYRLFGENWTVFHAQNVLLHSFTVATIFLFFNRLFHVVLAPEPSSRLSRLTVLAGAGALLYGLHPVTVYAVSYLIQRSIVMATLFSVLSLWCLLEATQRKRLGWYVGSALLYLLALSSKEHAIMLPLVGLAMIYTMGDRGVRLDARWMWAGATMILVAGGIIGNIYSENIGGAFDETSRQLIARLARDYPAVAQHPYLLSVINESYLFFKYLFLWLLPYPGWMAVDMREPFPTGLAAMPQALGPLLLAAYAGLAIFLLRKRKEAGLLGFALLTPLLLYPTELATVWIQDPFALYRSYLWMFALPAALPLVANRLPPKIALAAFTVMLLSVSAATWDRLGTFKSELALWDDVVRYNAGRTPVAGVLGIERSYNERALAYAQSGEVGRALADYTEAIRISPQDANIYSNRAAIYLLINDPARAQTDLEAALRLDPKNPKALYNQGAFYLKQGENDKAHAMFSQIITNNIGGITKDVYGARAVILLKTGKVTEALADLDQALKLDPKYVDGYKNRGTAYGLLGRNQQALDDFTQALKLNPQSIDAYVNRALVSINLSRMQDALRDVEDALSLDPTHIRSHLLRAQIFLNQGRIQDGLREYEVILRINPKEPMAYLNRGEVYLFLRDNAAAKRDLSQACQLGVQPACNKLSALGS